MHEKPTYEELEQRIQELEKAESKLKQVETSLIETEAILKAAMDFTPVAIAIATAPDGNLRYVNKAGLNMHGGTEEELVKEVDIDKYVSIWQIFHFDGTEYKRDEVPLARAIMYGETCSDEFVLKRPDAENRIVLVNASPIFDDKGNVKFGIAIFLDITERKRTEELIHHSEKQFKTLFMSMSDGFYLSEILFDDNGNPCDYRYLEVNPKFEQIIGLSRDQIIGKRYKELVPVDTTGWLDVYFTVARTGRPLSYEFYSKEFQMYFETYSYQPSKGQISVIVRNITERKQAEKERLVLQKIAGENEKLALVGQIAGKMAHDFNNILGIVMGNTELALLDCQEPTTKKTLELIYEQTQRGKNLTKNLVAFAKDQELKQEFFRISEKIDLVINLMRKDLERIELLKQESPGIPELLADPGMIEHALVNLIQNSIHALSKVEHPRITVRTYSRDNHICFEIEDNGCGISKENLENIYDPSFTLKGSKDVTGSYKPVIKGTGYGMSNVKKYIEQHKGTISVESEFGSGTKFTISLPVIKKELTNDEKIKIRTGNAHFEKYILLVEDETAIANVQYRILTQEPCNHKVDIANNGQVAMDLFERNKYDFISLDYILPGGINGMDIYNHIRSTNKTIPILFISGNIEFLESIKDLMKEDPYVDHMSKPCKNIHYLNCINKLFEKEFFLAATKD